MYDTTNGERYSARQSIREVIMRERDVDALGNGLRGELIGRDDAAYDAARRVWNGLIDRHPSLIVRCADADDVVASLRFAQAHDLDVAVRGGGHSVAGFGTCDDGIVIDLGRMKGIEVDADRRVARAQGGVIWQELDRETQRSGLATAGGVISTTGIGGLTLGGGFGWLSRRLGATVDSLLSAEVVTADGQIVTTSAHENEDLFWALRGGGGNFGVVTSFEYRLHQVGPTIFGGWIGYPLERADDLLRLYREWMPTAPDELSADVVLAPPPEEGVPEELLGMPMISVGLCYSGPLAAGEEAIAPLRELGDPALDRTGALPYTTMQSTFDSHVPHGICTHWKTANLSELTDGAIQALLEQFARAPSTGSTSGSTIVIEYLEGAFGRRDEAGTAFNNPGDPYRIIVEANSARASDSEASRDWARGCSEALAPFTTGSVYLNYLGAEGEQQVKNAYGASKFDKLRQIKQVYDPANVFRLNQNIPPEPHRASAHIAPEANVS
jgi:FAD binding domain/Berberine and berberine like